MKKRVLSFLTALALCLGFFPGTAWAEESAGGNWTDNLTTAPDGYIEEADTITITTPEALAWLAVLVNSETVTEFAVNPTYGKTVVLGADLDLGGKYWVPIGNGKKIPNAFIGSFDGNGHTISNLTIESQEGETHLGLFGVLHFNNSDGTPSVRGVTIEHASITTNHFDRRCYAGVLAAEVIGEGDISGCTVSGTINCKETSQNLYVGGIFGSLNPTVGNPDKMYLKVDRCFADVDISGAPMYAGGFVGYLSSCGEITNCGSTGDVTMTNPYADYPSAAGFIGAFGTANGKVNLESCYATGNVSLHSSSSETQFVYAGGFAGCIDLFDGSTVQGCFKGCMSSGDVTVTASDSESPMVGGFIGNGGQSPVLSITDSYSTGDVTATNGVNVLGGGFVGFGAVTAENCYSLGNVTSKNGSSVAWAFGFSAWTTSGASFTNCYALGEAMEGDTHAATFLNGDYTSDCSYYEGMTLSGTNASSQAVTALSIDTIAEGTVFASFDSNVWQLSTGGIPLLSGIPDDIEKTDKPAYMIADITFDSLGGSEVSPIQVKRGTKLPKPANPTRSGYTFTGWYTDEACTAAYDFSVPATGNLTLYAKWDVKEYTVTFHTGDGSPVEAQNVVHGGTAVKPESDPTREGCTFGGWYTDEACTEAYDFSAPVTGNLTLYAKWEAEAYTVTFNTGDGSQVEAQTVVHGGTAAKPESDPTREGCTFGGWFTDEACATAYDFGTPVTRDLTLYAKWTAIPSQPSGGGSSSGGGGGSGSGSSTTTTTSNPDGSTTTTTKNPNGTTTTTVKQPGGTTSTTTQDPKTGAQTTVIKTPEGVSFTEERDKAGAVTQVQASVPGGAERVTLPASVDRDTALEITVQDGGSAVVEIPAKDLTPGTVAVIVAPDGSETVVRQSVSTGDGVALTVEGSAVVKLVENGKTFSDVPQTHWAAEAAAFVSARELFSGTGPDTFSPNQPMSRGMLAVVLHNLERNPAAGRTGSFTDVPDRAWYSQGVAWAAERGIISGYGDGQFGPNAPVTREQLAVILWRYAGSPAPSGSDLPFGDADQVSSWASNALRWAVENGILSGYGDGRLAPQESATRAQMAQILKRFLEQQR